MSAPLADLVQAALNDAKTIADLTAQLADVRGKLIEMIDRARDNPDELDTPTLATIARNGMFWRNKEIARLCAKLILREPAPTDAALKARTLREAATKYANESTNSRIEVAEAYAWFQREANALEAK